MTDEERTALTDEWKSNNALLESIPENHTRHSVINARQKEIESKLKAGIHDPSAKWDWDTVD